MNFISVFKLWFERRKNWDEICSRCGKCCYSRHVNADGSVIIHYGSPCEYLDTTTQLCTVYEKRFRKCSRCRKVNLFRVLFNPTLPRDCAYVQLFRFRIEPPQTKREHRE